MEHTLAELMACPMAPGAASKIPDLLSELDRAMPSLGLGMDPEQITVSQVIVACERMVISERLSFQLKKAVLYNWPPSSPDVH